MTFDLPGGRRLVLAGGGSGVFWVAAGVAAVVLLLTLYREERRLVSRRAGFGLLALRLVAALVLVLALFEPIAATTVRETVRGRVIVAVDVSDSMTTADPGRPAEAGERLASLLKLAPGESITTMPRREVVRRLIDGPDAPLASLSRDHTIEAFAFARETHPATLATLADTLKRPIDPADLSTQGTDWLPALAEALKGSETTSAPVVAALVITDGRRNAEADPGPTLDRLAARGVPVFPLLVGSTLPPKDAAVASVKAPATVYKGDVAGVEVTLKLDGYDGQEVSVTLDHPGASPMRQTVRAAGGGARPVVSFRVPLNEVGQVPLTVAVAPMGGDVRPDNDRRTVTVQVADDKAKVLLVDGEARWEFRYLRNALARDPRVALDTVVFRQPKPGLSSDQVFTYGVALPERGATGADPLAGFDVIVVGDVAPGDVSAETWSRLDAFVAERGGTLVIAPGPRQWAALDAQPTARKLLPVVDPKVIVVNAPDPAHPSLPPGVAVAPTEVTRDDASDWPMFQLADGPEETRRAWSGLPGLPWAVAGRAKPGATTLATPRDDPESALIAAQPYGLGKVFFVGTDGTWRWRHRVGDAYHHRFWGQVVRWASAGKLAAGNALVRFGPTRPRADEGEPVRIQARIAEGVAGVGPDLLLAARVRGAGSKADAAVVPLRPVAGQPRVFEGVASGLPLGSYAIRLDVPALAESLKLGADGPTAPLEVVARDGPERVELAAARDALDRLAVATGGRVVADHEADTLSSLLRARSRETVRTEETPLWDTPAALLVFFAVVTAEWVARKWVGLP